MTSELASEPNGAPPSRRLSMPLLVMLTMFAVALSAVGYALMGAPVPMRLAAREVPHRAPAKDGAAPTAEQAQAIVDRLMPRLQSQPDDAPGWQTLARSDLVLHRYDDAVEAYRRASALQPRDATLVADQAYALAMAHHRNLQGEPLVLLGRALAMEPGNPKALALSGTAAFDRHDFDTALRYWETLARTQPPGSVFAQQVQPSIAEARRLGGVSSRAGPAPAAP